MTISQQALAAMQPPPGAPAAAWVLRINACWQASVKAILEVGRLLTEAKHALPHGEFGAMCEADLPFTARTAQMLMAIAADPRITNTKYISHLPASWGTLHDLTKLDDETFEARIAEGVIRPDMERADIKIAAQKQARAAHTEKTYQGGKVDDLHALVASGFKASAILADPPWHFLARSEKGEGRSASQHYTTDRTDEFEAIKSLPIAQLAAKDCVLFMWMVDWCPDRALEVIEAWGFAHKTTAFTWAKQTSSGEGWHMGQGYWTRANPEDCWLGTRGSPKRINADVRQLIIHPLMEHSRKPDETHDRIMRLVGGPYLEIYARRERAGWLTWGNEIQFNLPPVDAQGTPLACDANGEIRDYQPPVTDDAGRDHSVSLDSESDDSAFDIPEFCRRKPQEAKA